MTPEEQVRAVELLFEGKNTISARQGEENDETATGDTEQDEDLGAKLRNVSHAVQQAWSSGEEIIDLIAQKLGDESRDPSWRLPIGDSGLLDFFLNILPIDGLREPLKKHALRVIGNSCADTDENRARVVASNQFHSIVKLLADDYLLPIVTPVLYNICVDYEPTQLQACNTCLSETLVNIISGPRLLVCSNLLSIIWKILALLITQEPELRLANPETPILLLNLSTGESCPPDLELDPEDICGLTTVALSYLKHERFQSQLLSNHSFELLMQAYTQSTSLALPDPDDTAQLPQIHLAFVQIFADISALPSFPLLYPVSSPVVQTLINWLSNPPSSTHLQASCLCLGNLARSDEASIVLAPSVYPALFSILSDNSIPSSTQQLLHAVLSFLKNLAIPPTNKPLLGPLLDSILPKLWSTPSQCGGPAVLFAAVSLTRLLLAGCPLNAERLCSPLAAPPHGKTHLQGLITLCVDASVDAEPTKLEAARAVGAACRAFCAGDGDGRGRFYASHPDMAKALSQLIAQRKYPALRSEAWFVLALMSRCPDGARVAVEALLPTEACRALVGAVTGRDDIPSLAPPGVQPNNNDNNGGGGGGGDGNGDGDYRGGEKDPLTSLGFVGLEPQLQLQPQPQPQQQQVGVEGRGDSMKRIDRENGLVLVAEIVKKYADYLPSERRRVFEEMLRTGGKLVLQERKEEGQAQEGGKKLEGEA